MDQPYFRYRQYYHRLEPVLKKPQARAYIMGVLSFFTLSFLGAFAIRPAVTQIFELNRKISDRRAVTNQLDEKIRSLQLAEKAYSDIQADLPIILAAVPYGSTFPPLLKDLETNASSSAISVTSLRFQNVELLSASRTLAATNAASAQDSFVFSIGTVGDYNNLLDFLKNLEEGKRLIGVNQVAIIPEKTASGTGMLKMSVEAQTYFTHNKVVGKLNEP